MRISACSIVKNEEKNIARSIESYRKVVDEIIIVDTGSTDHTVSICEKLGATVLHYEWNNDFAAAKNFALDHATGDWVIFLDADEWFVPALTDNGLANAIKKAEKLSSNQVELLRITMCNVEEKTGQVISKTSVGRVFKHTDTIRYVGSIHEDIKNEGKPIVSAKVDELEIYHSGYSQAIVKEKSKRNLELLYDKYKKNEGDGDIYFYLCRENSILGKNEEALKFYDLFFQCENIDEIIKGANVFVSIYEFGIKLKMAQRDCYTSKEIKASIDEAIEKYPQLPMHYYLMGCYYFNLDHDKALEYLEKAVEMNKNYKGEYINNLVSAVTDAYLKIAYIYKAKQNNIKALDAIVEAVKIEPLEKKVFAMLMSLIRNQTPVDIILFLSRFYDIKNEEHVTFLTKELMWSRCHEVFLYFAKRYNQEFMQEDETTYIAMLLTNNAKEVIRVGMEAYFNGGKDDDRYFATLAMILSKDKMAFKQYKMSLNRPYAVIAQKFIENLKISNPTPEEIQAWQHLYSHMFYIASPEELERFENLFEETTLSIVPTIIWNMVGDEDYEKIKRTGQKLIDTIKDEQVQNDLKKIMAYEIYFSKDYKKAIDAFEEICKNKELDIDLCTLHYLQAIGNLTESFSLRKKANKLYEEYFNLALREREIEEAVRTNKIKDIRCEYKELDKKNLSQEAFETLVNREENKLKTSTLKNVFTLMEKYVEKGMDDMAFEMLILLIQNEYMKDVAYYRLGELFNRIKNSALSLYCHKQVFEENPLFANTLLGEKAENNRGYRYHDVEVETREVCPICGGKAVLDGVYNSLLSKDYTEQYPPIKKWCICLECCHMFAENIPVHISEEKLLNKKTRMMMEQTEACLTEQQEALELIKTYKNQGKVLDINAANPEFMLLAEEYGYQTKGLVASSIVADVMKQEYGIDIENVKIQEYQMEKYFDVISMINEIEEVSQPVELIKKAYELLAEDGILYIKTPNYRSAAARCLKDKGLVYRKARVVNYFSKESLERLLLSNGFKMISYKASKETRGYMQVIARK